MRFTNGLSLSSGRLVTWATAVSTPDNAACMSLPGWYSMITVPTPATELDRTRFTPSRKRSSGSSAWTMLVSMSSALAPGHSTVAVMISMPKSGKNCVLRRPSEKAPPISMIAISRFIAVG